MTPLDKIKEGILSNDMEKVIDGYEILTGERPSIKEKVKQEKKAGTKKKKATKVKDDFTAPPRKESGVKGKYTKSQKIEVGKNTFVDDGIQHKNDTTPDLPLTPRDRVAINYVEVTCHVCGNKEEVNPLLKAGDFYRCNECVG